MAISQGTPYETKDKPVDETVTVVNCESILGHVPVRRPENEPAPEGFFDWLVGLQESKEKVTLGVPESSQIPDYWNWLVDEHARWFREKHPGEQLEAIGIEMHPITEEDQNHLVDFQPAKKAPAKTPTSSSSSSSSSSTDDS